MFANSGIGGSTRRMLLAICTAGLCCAGSPATHAAADQDPPMRVAVVNFLEGAASVQPAGSQDWSDDVPNRPLTTGDKLWIDAASRGALQLGSTAIHFGEKTALEFLDLADDIAQLRMTSGTLTILVRRLSPNEIFEIDTPGAAISLVAPGRYRVDVNEAGDVTELSVAGGRADVATAEQSMSLYPQQAVTISGTDSVGVELDELGPPDQFDQWAANQDAEQDASASAQYLSTDVGDSQVLDDYGNWRTVAAYGAVWIPRVAAGWAPYHHGHWLWILPWGWTWVGAEPWGFAPFHYGRWVHAGVGWCWAPGPRAARPVYAAALVAWVGEPPPSGAAPAGEGGEAGWFALGFNEIYRPSYPASAGYLRAINAANTHIPKAEIIARSAMGSDRHYANQIVPGAIAVVPRQAIGSARAATEAGHRPQPDVFARPVAARTRPPRAAPVRLVEPAQRRVRSQQYPPSPSRSPQPVIESGSQAQPQPQPAGEHAGGPVGRPLKSESLGKFERRSGGAARNEAARIMEPHAPASGVAVPEAATAKAPPSAGRPPAPRHREVPHRGDEQRRPPP